MIIPTEDNFYRDLGDRIKTERIKRKISQEELAGQLELTRASVINLEKGRHRPSVYQIILISNYFNIDYTGLIPFVTEKPKKRTKASVGELDKMIIPTEDDKKSARTAVLDFLTAIKK
jgi:transcriptional regulator with XRE-family HTH domain